MARVIDVLPELTGDEMMYVQNLIKDFDDEKARQFANIYRTRRKEPMLILILALLGLVPGIAGIQRFILGQIGMGILYLLTLGLCLVGTVVDMVNYQKLSFEYNSKVANEVVSMM